MFTFRISQNTKSQALEGAGSDLISQLGYTKRVSSFADDLNTFLPARKVFQVSRKPTRVDRQVPR
jgi:hypothetical protein